MPLDVAAGDHTDGDSEECFVDVGASFPADAQAAEAVELPSRVDRARPGSKHHLIVDGQGILLAVALTGGNRNDITHLLPCSTRSRLSRTRSADRVGARMLCWPTAATTTTSTVAGSDSAASGP